MKMRWTIWTNYKTSFVDRIEVDLLTKPDKAFGG